MKFTVMRWAWRRISNRVVTTSHGTVRIVDKGDDDIASGPAKIIIKRIFTCQFMPVFAQYHLQGIGDGKAGRTIIIGAVRHNGRCKPGSPKRPVPDQLKVSQRSSII